MPTITLQLLRCAATIAALALAAAPSLAGTITLLPAITLESPRAITLADIADFTGDDARATSRAVVLSESELASRLARSGAATLALADVRSALAKSGQSTSRLAITGGSCDIRVISAAPKLEKPTVAKPAPVVASREIASTILGDAAAPPIKRAIAESLSTFLNTDPDRLRITFEPRDAAFITSDTGTKSVLARPLNQNAESGTIVVEVRLVETDAQGQPTSITIKAEVLSTVLRASRDIPRKAPIAHADLEQTEQWVSPGVDRAATDLTAAQAAGQTSRFRISNGTVITRDLISPVVSVKRNESFDVWVYQGNLAIKARATALKDGAVGETIPARLDRQRATFQVRLEGEKRGVVLNDNQPPPPPPPA